MFGVCWEFNGEESVSILLCRNPKNEYERTDNVSFNEENYISLSLMICSSENGNEWHKTNKPKIYHNVPIYISQNKHQYHLWPQAAHFSYIVPAYAMRL